MSVVKGKRKKSKVEFEYLYFKVADSVDTLIECNFHANKEQLEKNKMFLQIRSMSLQKVTDQLLYYIKIANSIYPTCLAEYEERRISMDKAIGTCFFILTNYQRILMRLKIPDNKYTEDILIITKMINSLKAWRKSDNRFKTLFQ